MFNTETHPEPTRLLFEAISERKYINEQTSKLTYPRWLVEQIMKKVLDEQTNRNVPTVTINLPNDNSHCSIKTPLIKENRVKTLSVP